MRVNPSYSLIAYGQTFNVSVTLTDVNNATGWQLTLYYSRAILNCTGVTEGPFLRSVGGTYFYKQINNTYNSTNGRLLLACTLLGNICVNGSGTLTTITFQAVSKGDTSLILADTMLADQRLPPQPIAHEVSNGVVHVGVIVRVDPSFYSAVVGEALSINVSVNGVAYLTGWQFILYYKRAQLNCTAVTEGPFLRSVGGTYFYKQINNTYNSTNGRLLLACTLLGNICVNGSGVLVTITFQAVSNGNTTLHLDDVVLSDQEMPPQPIPNTPVDGTVEVGGVHAVAVTNVVTSKAGCKPMPVVGKGYNVTANVTVQNEGSFWETFNVSLYANTTLVATAKVTNLSPGVHVSLVLLWNTAGFAYGNYSITAKAAIPSNETNTANDVGAGGMIKVSIPGDVDGDQNVTILDVVRITSIYYFTRGMPKFSPNCDIDGHGKITILDVVICTSHYGQKWH
jgi:hypothetical protein